MFGLLDINNFYASCERVFNPKLNAVPVIVLSNNDGCVIARSNEARALGIKMGQPFFEVKKLCQAEGVQAFSSNYALYGDMSRRVMWIIESSWPEVEVYSIDEAFLYFKGLDNKNIAKLGNEILKKIYQYTGLPASLGIGKTKTLAKLANHIAKRELSMPFFDISDTESYWCHRISVGEVWGIGRRLHKQLNQMGINSVEDFKNSEPNLIRKRFNIGVKKTLLELQGNTCLSLEEPTSKKGIMSSKSFGQILTDKQAISNALANFCARSCEKLRQQKSKAGRIEVFLRTNPFRQDAKQYNASTSMNLIHSCNDTREITLLAKKCLEEIFREGYSYKKVGVYLDELTPDSMIQQDLFDQLTIEESHQSKDLMKVIDQINAKFGRSKVHIAAEGFHQPWKMNQNMKTPCYTTNWADLLTVKID